MVGPCECSNERLIGFHKVQAFSLLAEELLASEEGLHGVSYGCMLMRNKKLL